MITSGTRMSRLAQVVSATTVLIATGCSSGSTAAPGASNASGEAPSSKSIAWVGALTPNVYYDNVLCGMKSLAKKNNIDVIDTTPSTFSASAQVAALEAAIARKPSGLVVGPAVAVAVTSTLNRAVSQGIPVTIVANPVFPVNAITFINADVSQATKLGVDEMARLLPTGGEVAIVALQPNSGIDALRVNGYKAALKSHPSLKLVQTEYSGVNTANASQIVAGIIAAHPQVSGVLVTSGTPTVGVATQVLAAHKTGKIKVIGYDASPNAVEKLKQGTIQAIVSQLPRKAGELSVQSIMDSAVGKSAPKEQNYNPFLITPQNVDTPEGTAAIYSPCP